MRAICFDAFTPLLDAYHTADVPTPTPGPDEVQVRVAYAALNRLDDFVRRGWKGLEVAFPHIPCADFSGQISALGAGVTGWAVGDSVTANPMLWCGQCDACTRGDHNCCERGAILGEHVQGACADFVVVPARNLVRIPPDFDLRKAAAASLVYLTAWHSLVTLGRVAAGDKVLIVGAGGGVNTASLHIARLLGAEVYVIAGDAAKAQAVRDLGAVWVYDRSAAGDEWARAVFVATERTGIDIVVDNVGAPTWAQSLRTLRTHGRLLTVGGSGGYDATVPVNLLFGRHLSILGSTMGSQADYQVVMAHVFAERLAHVIDSIFPLDAFPAAMARLVANAHFCKILIDVQQCG